MNFVFLFSAVILSGVEYECSNLAKLFKRYFYLFLKEYIFFFQKVFLLPKTVLAMVDCESLNGAAYCYRQNKGWSWILFGRIYFKRV